MRDRSKQLLVINTGKKESEQTRLPAQSGTTHIIGGGGLSVNMADYLLKSIWDKVFEIRTDSQGIEYIFGKLPMVTQYGITMFSGEGVNVPNLASGLPFDGRTIWYNPDTNQIEVIGGTGGGSGEGVSNFWDLSGIPSWITNSKPKYTYSEIEGTPDLSGFATQNWIISQGYASAEVLSKYIPISGYTEVSGEKNFTGGLKVNGSHIYYDSAKKYWKLEGDLLVTGGVTMYGNDSSFTPSTIMDAILYDSATLGINSNGQLYVKGGTSGGGLDITALQNYLTQNSYLNVTSGDNRYLKLSGGTITGHLGINASTANAGISISYNGTAIGSLSTNGSTFEMFNNNGYGITTLGKNLYALYNWNRYTLWHSGNDGSGSGLDADLLDGLHNGELTALVLSKYSDTWNYSLGNPGLSVFSDWYNTQSLATYFYGISIESVDNNYRSAIAIPLGGNGLYWRRYSEGSWLEDWRCLIDSYNIGSYNAGSATKLQTARTIWGQSFDGTGNVSGVISNTHTIEFDTSLGAANIGYLWTNTRGMHMDMSGLGTEQQGTNLTLTRYGNVGIGTPNPSQKLHVKNGNITCDGGFVQSYRTNNPNSSGAYMRLTSYYPEGDMTWDAIIASDYYGNHLCTTGGFTHGMYFKSGRYGYDNFIFLDSQGNPVARLSTSSGAGNHHFVGNMFVTGGITMYSDKRKKTILNHVELSLKQIADAPLIEHYYNSDEKKTTHVGSIAQYWASMNDWFCKLDSEGYYTMEIQNAALASAISIARELDRYETKTDKAIKKLKKRICELEEEVERLKSV